VNHDVVFEVTSEGRPVEGAIVHFAGFEKHTGKDGKAVFNIDMAGPFKARAEKPGYEDASTLLWVFPEGNEKFPIRAIRLHSEQAGTTIADYRMAGANCASIKVYYLYDENGNVYPAIPFPLGWRRYPRNVYQKFYEWQISEARRWGFEKIFLMGQPLEAGPYERGVPQPLLSDQAKAHFMEQMQREALWLAEFAQEMGVDILDPVNLEVTEDYTWDVPPEHSLKGLVPEFRERFSGELAVQMATHMHFLNPPRPEYSYSEFDYLTPVFDYGHNDYSIDSPSKLKALIHEYFDFAEKLGERDDIKVMPIWVASLLLKDLKAANQIIGMFRNYENARVWLLDTILKEASKRDVAGVEVYMPWYHSRLVGPHGPYADQFSVWQSKRPLDTIAKHFSNPWNEEGRETLRVLQHAALMTNSIASHDQEFAEWGEDRVAEALKAYRSGDYVLANSIASEILKRGLEVENPLSIRIDGDASEWQSLDPVYFNPSRILPWSSLSPWFNPETDIENLKCVYAANDSDILYMMLEFYELPQPVNGLHISIDTSGEWTHQEGQEYNIILCYPGGEICTSKYEGNKFDTHGKCFGDVRVAYGNVIEVKVPLEYIGHPERANLLVWYPGMAEWGGMEVNIVKWYENTR